MGARAEPPPWREVLAPHDDVATGDFRAADFAADLHRVADPGARADPAGFFRRTHLTVGLRDLVVGAVRRLAGDDNAAPVITLETGLGGGKTHAMLSLWHLAGGAPSAQHPAELRELVAGAGGVPGGVRRVALVGQHFAPTGEVRGGRRIHTLWGELAWQLGGEDGYALVADADRAGTNPGRALHELLARHTPALILVDEWAAYLRQLPDRRDAGGPVAGGTLDAQLTFAQSLAEAVRATSGVLLAVAIPTAERDSGTGDRLGDVLRRVADPWRPASTEEVHRIVRRRLFVEPDARSSVAIDATARSFAELYRSHPGDFPREARAAAYRERIRQSYPFHPELLDRIDRDWSGLERFQHTRGLLRLMSTVVHTLWAAGDAGPLIMPGAIPMATSAVGAELAQQLPDRWHGVIDADVDGPGSAPRTLDAERAVFGQRAIATRLARTVFLGTAPAPAAHRAIATPRVLLGTATPGDLPGNLRLALNALGDRAEHLHSGSERHWYDLRPNLIPWVRDRAERVPDEEVWAEITRRLRARVQATGDFAAVHVCPDGAVDVPDRDVARLVVLHPRLTHTREAVGSTAAEFARAATEARGAAHRTYRNMVVHLAGDAGRMVELEAGVRDHLAWSAVLSSPDLELTTRQRRQAEERRRLADEVAESRISPTYQWALVPEQQDPAGPYALAESKVGGSAPSLAEQVSRRLRTDGQLNTAYAAAAIRVAIDKVPTVWARGHVSVGGLWQLFATYPYLPRLRDRSVLAAGVRDQPPRWRQEGFALADGFDGERYVGLVAGPGELPVQVGNGTLLVRPDVAQRQLGVDEGSAALDEAATRPDEQAVTRFVAGKSLDRERCALDFERLADEVIAPLAAADARVTVRVEIEASSPGFDNVTVRTVSENASALRLDGAGFEA